MQSWRAVSKGAHQTAERLPLKWRLALASFGLLAVLMAALGALVSVTQERAMLGNQAASLRQTALLVNGIHGPQATPSAPPPIGPFPANSLGVVDTLVHQLTGPGTRAVILGTDGTVIDSDSNDPSAPPQVGPSEDAIKSALTTAQPDNAYSLAYDSSGHRQLVVLLPLIDTQSHLTVALLMLSTPTAPIDRSVATMRLTLGVGILAALAIAAMLTIPLMNTALRPLVDMERVSGHIAAGDLSLRLDVPPAHDEIGRLARAFNSMVAQLEAAFARQQRFVADVSHELRTPLTALGGSLEMLLLGADRGDASAARRLTRGMYAEVERMRRLVEDLLTLARLDEGRAGLRADVIAVGSVLNEVYEQAQQMAHGQQIDYAVAPDLPPIRADSERLRQVLLNLVVNALKYTPDSGRIDLSARREEQSYRGGKRGEEVVIEVRDTGEGIPPEALPHVFERFYRADPARARSSPAGGGSGLGLAIAKSLVEAQGGQIAIASALGEGTIATVRLPAVRQQPIPATVPSTAGERAIEPDLANATRPSEER
jgi:two-component system OmpR family sensor kinase